MKVKCRGYEGDLVKLNFECYEKQKDFEIPDKLYSIRIALICNASVDLEKVKESDIEFIK